MKSGFLLFFLLLFIHNETSAGPVSTSIVIVGSEDCVNWRTIVRVESSALESSAPAQVPLSQRIVLPCIGFKLLESGRTPDQAGEVTIQDAKFYQTGCKKVDMQLILDASGSMGTSGWNKLIEFVKDLINGIFGNSESRLAIMRYGDKSTVLQELKANVNGSWLKDKKYDYVNMRRTFTGNAMDDALPAFKNATVDSDSKKILVVITDGLPTPLSTPVWKAAPKWEAIGAKIYAIGIGNSLNKEELRDFFTYQDNTSPRFFAEESLLKDFETLEMAIFKRIVPDICDQD